MPRRTHARRRVQPRWQPAELPERQPTPEQMARELVKAGKCSPLILDRPQHPTERNTA